jgi:hypothetical protein
MNPSAGRRGVCALTAQHNKAVATTATTRMPRPMLELFMSIP